MSQPPLNSEQLLPVEAHDRHCLLSAGAGSGKTRVLVERYLRILADADWDPGLPARILAITFTEKAAAEMRHRIVQGLAQRARAEADAGRVARLVDLGRELESAPIGTIHGFCSRLLGECALVAGLDPLFRIPGEVELFELQQEILDGLFREGDEDLLLLAGEFGVGPVTEALEALRGLRRSLGLPHAELLGEGAQRLAASQDEAARAILAGEILAWREGLDHSLANLCAHLPGGQHPREADRRKLAAALARLRSASGPGLDADLLAGLREDLKGLQSKGKAIDDDGRLAAAWDRLKGELAQYGELAGVLTAVDPDGPRLAAAAFRLAGRYATALDRAMRERSWLDFEDLQLKALALLEGDADLRQRYREHYRHVLVDEFQDTNLLQLRLIRQLVPEDAPAQERALFLVGDERQSIYAFRNADVEVFRGERARMELRGETHALGRNHRSRAALLEFFNDFFPHDEFPPLLPPEGEGEEDPPPRVLVQLTCQSEAAGGRDEARLAAARALADTILEAKTSGLLVGSEGDGLERQPRPVEWRDVAILVRSSGAIGPLARALAERGIPYEAAGGREYWLRQELRDLEDLVAALDDPYQRLKLARGLRTDIIGLATADLVALMPPPTAAEAAAGPEGRDRGALLQRLREAAGGSHGLSEDGRLRAARFLALHRRFEHRLYRLPLAQLVSELVEATGFDLHAATEKHALKTLRNLRQLADLLAELESSRRLTVREWLDTMSRVREISPRREEAWVPEEGDSRLRILTIHSAKGLEFPLLVVADLDREIGRNQWLGDLPCLRAELPGAADEALAGAGTPATDNPRPVAAWLGLRRRPPGGEAVNDAVYEWISRESSRRSAAENLRLLYVAMTRARDYLILSGVVASESPADLRRDWLHPGSPAEGSFLQILRHRLVRGLPPERYRLHVAGEGPGRLEGPRLAGAAAPAAAIAPLASADWGPLLGLQAQPGPLELPVTGLGLLNACPLRWLLERRLRLRGKLSPKGQVWIPDASPDAESGATGGAAMGQLLHQILERWDFHAPAESAFAAACPSGLDEPGRGEARDLLLGLFAENFPWQKRLRQGSAYCRELPFLLEMNGVVLSGQVDLVFESGGRRYLVDWKSDRVGVRDQLAQRIDHHKLQVALYMIAMSEAGLPVDQAALCFLRLEEGKFRHVDIRDGYLEWVRNRVGTLSELARSLSAMAPSPAERLAGLAASDAGFPRPYDPPCADCPFRDRPCPRAYRQSATAS